MTARIRLLPSGHEFPAEPQETLLDAALRAGLSPQYSCNSGSCGECRARVVSGRPGMVRHHDYVFDEAERNQDWLLLCSTCAGSNDLVLEAVEAGGVKDIPVQQIVTRVDRLERLGEDFLVLHLRTPRSQTLRFLAGQHVNVTIPDLPPRDKSIASCPCNAMHVQFHLRRVAGDAFSEHVFTRLKPQQPVTLTGPYGDFTLDERESRPLILLACDTGFAPIKSLIEHAISLEYGHPLHLYWVVRRAGDHYLENYCRAWLDALDNFTFTPLVGRDDAGDPGSPAAQANFLLGAQRIVADHPALGAYTVYASGPESAMPAARELLLAHGLAEAHLHVDYLRRF